MQNFVELPSPAVATPWADAGPGRLQGAPQRHEAEDARDAGPEARQPLDARRGRIPGNSQSDSDLYRGPDDHSDGLPYGQQDSQQDPLPALERVLAALPYSSVQFDQAGIDRTDGGLLGKAFASLAAAGVDRPPLPGGGATLTRWRMLAAVAACDLGLVKLYEGHTDAVAILAELGGIAPLPGSRWAVWAAEPPAARLVAQREKLSDGHSAALRDVRPDGHANALAGERRAASAAPRFTQSAPAAGTLAGTRVRLHGTKAWCSGAANVSNALLTAWLDDVHPCLVAIDLTAPGVRVTHDGWHARGMSATASVDVILDDVSGVLIGEPGDYLRRPGFWHGGAGIAACWFGAAAAIGRQTLQALSGRAKKSGEIDDISALHAAEIDLALSAAATLLREAATAIDADPGANAQHRVMRVRLDVEAAVDRVLRTAGRALGAAPLCRDPRFAALMTDLPVFLRQSHAERDLAAYGRDSVLKGASWTI